MQYIYNMNTLIDFVCLCVTAITMSTEVFQMALMANIRIPLYYANIEIIFRRK